MEAINFETTKHLQMTITPSWLKPELYPFKSRYFSFRGSRLHYLDEGEGIPLVFSHPAVGWSFMYRALIRELRQNYRCIAVDYPGFGLSETPNGYSYTLRSQSEALEALIDIHCLFTAFGKIKSFGTSRFSTSEAFDHSYKDISFIVNKSVENCRQIFSRSKKRLRNKEKRYDFDNRKAEAFLQQLIAYAEEGRYEELTHLFVEDAVVIADGGGKVRGALKHILLGAEKAGKFVLGATRKLSPVGSIYTKGEFNGAPAIKGSLNGQVFLVLFISHNGEQITELYALANPDKLKHLMA